MQIVIKISLPARQLKTKMPVFLKGSGRKAGKELGNYKPSCLSQLNSVVASKHDQSGRITKKHIEEMSFGAEHEPTQLLQRRNGPHQSLVKQQMIG